MDRVHFSVGEICTATWRISESLLLPWLAWSFKEFMAWSRFPFFRRLSTSPRKTQVSDAIKPKPSRDDAPQLMTS